MKNNIGYMVVFLLGSSSLCAMDYVSSKEAVQGQGAQQGNLMFDVIKNSFFGEKPKSEVDIFPLGEDIGHAGSFDEIFAFAHEGNLAFIQKFCSMYQNLKNYTDRKEEYTGENEGYTLVDFAALGYINEKDSWATFAYLIDNKVPLSDEFIKWLNPAGENEESGPLYRDETDKKGKPVLKGKVALREKMPNFSIKVARREQIRRVLKQKAKFKPNDEEGVLFYNVPPVPPYVAIEPEPTSLFSSALPYAALLAVGTLAGYLQTIKSLKAEVNTTNSVVSKSSEIQSKK